MIYMGLGVHKYKCVATIKGKSKKELEQQTFENTKEGISNFVGFVQGTYATKIKVVCESTVNYWIRLYDILEDNGNDIILAHPAKTKVIAQTKLKNDKIDSEILADLLRSDMISESFVPEKHYRDMRSLVRIRLGLVRIVSRYKNMIYAIIAKYDYDHTIKNIFIKVGLCMINELDLSDIDKMILDTYLENINTTKNQIGEFDSKMI